MVNELKQACDYALATIVAHLGDSHHITRFHVPAIEDYIRSLEGDAPAGPDVTSDDQPVDFDMMTRDQLRDHAADQGIDLAGATKKADIVAAIQQHIDNSPETEAGALGEVAE